MEGLFQIETQFLEVRLGREAGGVEFFQGFGDALGLRAGKALGFELMPFVSITSVCIDG